jgi:UDP-N-acetyl-D-glucosamine dehydrogenase
VATRFIELAGEINTSMPDFVVQRVFEVLNSYGKAIKGSRILILGLAYKPNVDDERESPTYFLMQKLEERGAIVEYNDPYVPVIHSTREFPKYAGKKSVEVADDYDLILVSTAHDAYKSIAFENFKSPVLDTRNLIKKKLVNVYQA